MRNEHFFVIELNTGEQSEPEYRIINAITEDRLRPTSVASFIGGIKSTGIIKTDADVTRIMHLDSDTFDKLMKDIHTKKYIGHTSCAAKLYLQSKLKALFNRFDELECRTEVETVVSMDGTMKSGSRPNDGKYMFNTLHACSGCEDARIDKIKMLPSYEIIQNKYSVNESKFFSSLSMYIWEPDDMKNELSVMLIARYRKNLFLTDKITRAFSIEDLDGDLKYPLFWNDQLGRDIAYYELTFKSILPEGSCANKVIYEEIRPIINEEGPTPDSLETLLRPYNDSLYFHKDTLLCIKCKNVYLYNRFICEPLYGEGECHILVPVRLKTNSVVRVTVYSVKDPYITFENKINAFACDYSDMNPLSLNFICESIGSDALMSIAEYAGIESITDKNYSSDVIKECLDCSIFTSNPSNINTKKVPAGTPIKNTHIPSPDHPISVEDQMQKSHGISEAFEKWIRDNYLVNWSELFITPMDFTIDSDTETALKCYIVLDKITNQWSLYTRGSSTGSKPRYIPLSIFSSYSITSLLNPSSIDLYYFVTNDREQVANVLQDVSDRNRTFSVEKLTGKLFKRDSDEKR